MTGQVEILGDQPGVDSLTPVAVVPRFYRRQGPGGGLVQSHPLGVDVVLGDVYVTGPGTLRLDATGYLPIERQRALLAVERLAIRCELPVAGGERPVLLTAWLQRQTGISGDELARWTDVWKR
jgi:hypothetical protein